MKRLLLLINLAVWILSVHADDYDYPYLTLQATDGTEQSVAVESLQITFADSALVATNSDGTKSFLLTELSKMYFSATSVDGIESIGMTSADGDIDVYTTDGILMGHFGSAAKARETLRKGLYVIKTGDKTYKMTVK